uniref:Ig-like domain-containing protein n=1 Tax=Neolamprologus brichardi TaxID=32507 RepID=A0A3Q4G7F0_NEOBR
NMNVLWVILLLLHRGCKCFIILFTLFSTYKYVGLIVHFYLVLSCIITCSGGLSMFWFREGSNPSHPSIIYTDGNRHHKCGNSSATQQSCVYQFNKSISSSDEGTYYCAVATCGKILFGKGTKLQGTGFIYLFLRISEKSVPFVSLPECSVWSQTATTVIFLLCPVLVLIVIAVLAYTIKKTNSDYCKGNCSYSEF